MNKQDLAVATITWVRDDAEEILLRNSLEILSKFGVPVFIADGGSPETFISFLQILPNVRLVPSHAGTLWGQIKASMTAAKDSSKPYILYTEPDKALFFTQLSTIVSCIELQERLGILLMSRSEKGFASFPAFQQMTETTINNCCRELLQPNADYTYGPFIINADVVENLLLVTEDTGWGWRPLSFALAHKMNYKISAVVKDFICPASQVDDSLTERKYRIKQLSENIRGLLVGSK